ncbi:MAG: aminopeptidase P N-terminal domain-containing protein [Bacteroidota bacterium]|nr:aminopeptidase P N-terminal domain-containing protein [Bacteroidota bacterium]
MAFNETFHINKRQKLSDKFEKGSIAIIHSNDEMPRNGDQYFPFRQNSDLYYLTGIEQEKSILLLAPDHPVKKNREVLFILKPDKRLEIYFGHKLSGQEATAISGVQNVQYLEAFESILDEALSYTDKIYFNSNDYPKFSPDTVNRDTRFANELKKKYPAHQPLRLQAYLAGLRLIKQQEEIDAIKKACDITATAFQRVLKFTRPGVIEYQVEAEILHTFLSEGARGPAYPTIVASGINACTLHYVEKKSECRDAELLLMDFGAEYLNYAADCSRTIPVNGKFTARQKEYYNSVLHVQNEIVKHFVVGNTIENINREVISLMEKELLKLGLITEEEIKKAGSPKPLVLKYLVHGIAHFIGLDVHDVGSRFIELKPGMVLTCEPGLYIPEEKTGIRIENDILITEEGPVNLMENIPVEIEEIEGIMNS